MGIFLSINTRTAENVRSASFSFTSLSFTSFWSGQLIVPANLSPSFLIVSSAVRLVSPILYSHFHVPTGSALSAALARPQNPSTNAIERTAFMIASEKWGREAVERGPPPAADSESMDAATAGQATVISTRSAIRKPPRPNDTAQQPGPRE